MQHIAHQVRLADSRQASKVHQLVLVLNVFYQLVELDFTWDEISYFCFDRLEFYMVASAIQYSTFLRPSRLAVLWAVLILTLGDHELESVGLFVAKLESDIISCHVEGFADGLTREHLGVEGLGKADRCLVQDGLTLLAAYNVWHIALLEYFAHKLRHASRDENDLDFCCSSL